jgi:hypothetical protein
VYDKTKSEIKLRISVERTTFWRENFFSMDGLTFDARRVREEVPRDDDSVVMMRVRLHRCLSLYARLRRH